MARYCHGCANHNVFSPHSRVLSQSQGFGKFTIFNGLSLPSFIAPFISLTLTTIVVRRASISGHLGGILSGFVIAYKWCDDISDYWVACGMLWCLLSCFLTTSFKLPEALDEVLIV